MADVFRAHLATDELSEWGDLLDLIRRGRPAWHRDAACKEHPDTDWFRRADEAAAKRVCRDCLVVRECRLWALEQGPELAGLWGGMTERDRAAIRQVDADRLVGRREGSSRQGSPRKRCLSSPTDSPHDRTKERQMLATDERRKCRSGAISGYNRRSQAWPCRLQPNWPSDVPEGTAGEAGE